MISKKRRFVAVAIAAAATVTSLATVAGSASAKNASAINRNADPFSSATKFCVKDTKKYNTQAIDDGTKGYSATEINIGQLITDFAALRTAGRVAPKINMQAGTQALVDYINNVCGGVRGRKVVYSYPTISLNPAVSNAGGQSLWDKVQPVAAFSASGNAGVPVDYLVKERNVLYFGDVGGDMSLAKTGSYFTLNYPAEVGWKMLGDAITKLKLLKPTDKVALMGFAGPTFDWTANAKTVLLPMLQKLGIPDANMEWATTSCLPTGPGGSTVCTGIKEAVAKFKALGATKYIHLAVPATNIIDYFKEYATAGWNYEVGYGTGLNNAASSDNQAHSVCVASVPACDLYKKISYIDTTFVGPHRRATKNQWTKTAPFNMMCIKTWNDGQTDAGNKFDLVNDSVQIKVVVNTCMFLRYIMKAIYKAGVNPTRAEINKAARTLGEIDGLWGTKMSLRPGKTWIGSAASWQKIVSENVDGAELCPKARGIRNLYDDVKKIYFAACFTQNTALNRKTAAAGGISLDYTLATLK